MAAQTEPHGWLCSETLATRAGDFEFVNGYPTEDTAERLRELQLFNRGDGGVPDAADARQ